MAIAVPLVLGACTHVDAPRADKGLAAKPLANGAKPHSSAYASRPNIIYILADDLGYGDIGPYGQRITKTPVLDRLAAEGMVFRRHYSGSTVCAPSRASLMTGLDTGNVSIRGNREFGGYEDENERGQMPLPASEPTIAEMMRQDGYATGMVGKWGLGGPGSGSEPQQRGFDYFFGYLDQKQSHNYYPTHLWENGKRYPLDNRFFIPHPYLTGTSTNPADYKQYMGKDYASDFLTRSAINWLDTQKGALKPFFLYLAYTTPHASLQVPDEELAQYKGIDDKPTDGGGYTPHPFSRAARAGMITRMDRDIGRIFATLKANGQLENTLIIFTSDNGASAEGGADLAFFDATGGLRGEKRDLYEGGVRAPMIAWWPGRIAAGSSSDHISAFWDVMPTLAELAGAPKPARTNGISFAPTLVGEAQPKHDHLYWEFHEGERSGQAVVMGKWKVIRFRPSSSTSKEARRIELFDLDNDRKEQRNVAAAHPDIVAKGIAFMDRRIASPIAEFNFVN